MRPVGASLSAISAQCDSLLERCELAQSTSLAAEERRKVHERLAGLEAEAEACEEAVKVAEDNVKV